MKSGEWLVASEAGEIHRAKTARWRTVPRFARNDTLADPLGVGFDGVLGADRSAFVVSSRVWSWFGLGRREYRGSGWVIQSRSGDGGWRREGFGVVEEVVPLVEAVGEGEFGLNAGYGLEEELADIGESGGVAGRDAVLGDGGVEASEDVVDVGGGHEVAGKGLREFGAEAAGLLKLEFGVSVGQAEVRVSGVTEHAAAATVGERELTKI